MEICGRIAPEYKEVEEGHFCACHLYNSAEDTERLLAEAAILEEEERARAEKEAKKPLNVAKAKIVSTVKKVFKKDKKEDEAAVAEESAPESEVKEIIPPVAEETQTEAPAEVASPAEVALPAETASQAEVAQPAEVTPPAEVAPPAPKKTTKPRTKKTDNGKKE